MTTVWLLSFIDGTHGIEPIGVLADPVDIEAAITMANDGPIAHYGYEPISGDPVPRHAGTLWWRHVYLRSVELQPAKVGA